MKHNLEDYTDADRYWFFQYYTDTGEEQTCDLLDRDDGEPWQCPAYDRLKEENEDEAPK